MSTSLLGRLRRRVLGISPDEARCEQRGFEGGTDTARQRVETIGRTFIAGYLAALEQGSHEHVIPVLEEVTPELQGFAFEGAAMGLALLDRMSFSSRRLQGFLADDRGSRHRYMIHVGAGWAAARLPFKLTTTLRRLDPLLGWLAVDGYGFHEGYFHWPSSITRQVVPRQLHGYARRAFDQGLGRSLWFVRCADVPRIIATIAEFEEHRRPQLWSGIGLAAVYAGGVDQVALKTLVSAAGPYRPELAQGAAFAAKARLLAGLGSEHTELACRLLCDLPAAEAAAITDEVLAGLPADGELPAYEVWRQRIQDRFRLPSDGL